MGRDKAHLDVAGTPMLHRVINALRDAGCDPVAVVGGDPDRIAASSVHYVPDGFAGDGPLGGIISALRWRPGEAVLVVACDLPLLSGADLGRLLAGAAPALDPALDVVVAVTDRIEPLCALWLPSALAPLKEIHAAGERAVQRAIAGLRTARVDVTRRSMTNVNTPADLAGVNQTAGAAACIGPPVEHDRKHGG